MARRTYVPTLLSVMRKLARYIERYDNVIRMNLTGDRLAQFEAFASAVRSYEESQSGYDS